MIPIKRQFQKQILRPFQSTKKVMEHEAVEHENDDDTNCNWCAWNNTIRLGKKAGRVEIRKTGRDHPKNSTVKIG